LKISAHDLKNMSDEKFWNLYAEALWLEDREMSRTAAAIAKAFGAK
jgi:hypothetical protein